MAKLGMISRQNLYELTPRGQGPIQGERCYEVGKTPVAAISDLELIASFAGSSDKWNCFYDNRNHLACLVVFGHQQLFNLADAVGGEYVCFINSNRSGKLEEAQFGYDVQVYRIKKTSPKN